MFGQVGKALKGLGIEGRDLSMWLSCLSNHSKILDKIRLIHLLKASNLKQSSILCK